MIVAGADGGGTPSASPTAGSTDTHQGEEQFEVASGGAADRDGSRDASADSLPDSLFEVDLPDGRADAEADDGGDAALQTYDQSPASSTKKIPLLIGFVIIGMITLLIGRRGLRAYRSERGYGAY